MFIARVSRGRTIGEFVIGVLLVPTVVGILWLTAFGTTTLRQHTSKQSELNDPAAAKMTSDPTYWVGVAGEGGELKKAADGTFLREEVSLTTVQYLTASVVTPDGRQQIDTLPTALFVLIDGLFESKVLVKFGVGIATLCIVLFFVTSSDSASMVIDIIASGGNPDPPLGTRLFWALTEGTVAAALLIAGGLEALQAAAIAAALPFTIVLLMACWSLVSALTNEEQLFNQTNRTTGED
jgi:choline-glycine betaine transporter